MPEENEDPPLTPEEKMLEAEIMEGAHVALLRLQREMGSEGTEEQQGAYLVGFADGAKWICERLHEQGRM